MERKRGKLKERKKWGLARRKKQWETKKVGGVSWEGEEKGSEKIQNKKWKKINKSRSCPS